MATGLRGRTTEALSAVALCGLLLLLIPVWAVHHAAASLRTRRSSGETRCIRRDCAQDQDLDELIRGDEPVIIEGLVPELALPLVPDLDGLRQLASADLAPFRVRSHKSHSPYFLYVGDYGAELDRVADMTFAEFLTFMFDGEHENEPEICTYRLFGVSDLDGAIGDIIDSMADGLSRLTDRRPDRQASGIWIGSTGVVTPLHHDAWTGLLFQMTGSKRVLMFPPTERPNLYFTSPFAARDRWSALPGRSSDADPARYPRYRRANRFEAQLDAGDVLFIPAFWSHEIEALEANISIPFRFGTRIVDQVNPGFLRPAFEIFNRKYLEPATSR